MKDNVLSFTSKVLGREAVNFQKIVAAPDRGLTHTPRGFIGLKNILETLRGIGASQVESSGRPETL